MRLTPQSNATDLIVCRPKVCPDVRDHTHGGYAMHQVSYDFNYTQNIFGLYGTIIPHYHTF